MNYLDPAVLAAVTGISEAQQAVISIALLLIGLAIVIWGYLKLKREIEDLRRS